MQQPELTQIINKNVSMINLPCLGIKKLLTPFVLIHDKIAIFEAGTTNTAELLLEGLSQLGISPKDVDYLIVSHIHLDHAGGAGYLAQKMPQAKVMVHEKGARHLIDPSRLIAATKKVFGSKDVIKEHYGDIIPIPADQVISLGDGDKIDLGTGRQAKVIHTPGHAPHHLCLYDPLTSGIFSGEALGILVKDLNMYSPSTPMPDFNLSQSIDSILRLLAYNIQIIYLSHAGYTRQVQDTIYKIIGQLICWEKIIKDSPDKEAADNLEAYVLQKEWPQWNIRALAKEHNLEDNIKWMTWRIGAVLAPGIKNSCKKS